MTRTAKRYLIGSAVVLGVFVAFLVEERVRGHLALQAWERGMRARREKLTVAELAPPITNRAVQVLTPGQWQTMLVPSGAEEPSAGQDIPVGQEAVLWRLTAWRTRNGATNNWARFATEFEGDRKRLAAFRAGIASRPIVVRLPYEQGFRNLMPHLGALRGTVQSLHYDTLLALHENQLDEVVENLRAAAVLTEILSHEVVVINQMVRVGVAGLALGGMLWQALQADGWSDAQLAAIQQAWERPRFLEPLARALEMERAMVASYYQGRQGSLRELADDFGWGDAFGAGAGPNGGEGMLREWLGPLIEKGQGLRRLAFLGLWWFAWAEQDQRFHHQAVQRAVEAMRTAIELRDVSGLKGAGNGVGMDRFSVLQPFGEEQVSGFTRSRHWFSLMVLASFDRILEKSAQTECHREMSVAAVALKRYRLRHREWPASLEALVPEYLSEVPRDWMNGEVLGYRRHPDDTFTLYSVGLDGQDDGGDPAPRQGTNRSIYQGRDMVWERAASGPGAVREGTSWQYY